MYATNTSDLLPSSIWVKTIKYTDKKLNNLDYEMKFISTEGYCEK
jgi:hypothetical protein